ncbi:MAG: extracellular solute-binding protein [Patescibacteria group bacterium]|nr:extracellular solute-binding protein [Patescibacteria group bacterium]
MEETTDQTPVSSNPPIPDQSVSGTPPLVSPEQPLPEVKSTPSFVPETVKIEDSSQVSIPQGGNTGKNPLFAFLAIIVLALTVLAVIFLVLPRLKLKPVTLTYWGLWEPEKIMQPIIADFQKTHPKITINYVRQSPKQYRERLASSLARGEGPDLFRIHNTWQPMFNRDLAPVPKKILQTINFNQNFYPVVTENFKKGSDYFAVPLEIDGLGLYINEELFRTAGKIPTVATWNDLKKLACEMTTWDEERIQTAGVALGATNNVEHWSDILGLLILQSGVDPAKPTGSQAEDALTFFHSFETIQACDTPPGKIWDETLDNSLLAFAKGKVAMIFAPSWEAFEIKSLNSNLQFKILPVPQLSETKVNWASYWAEGVWAKSPNKDEAFEFLNYLSSKEVMTKLYAEEAKIRLFGEPYARVDLGNTLVNDPYLGAYISQAPLAKSFYLSSRTYDNGINDKIIKYFEDALNSLDKGVSPTAALETVDKGVNQVLSTYGLVSSLPAGKSARE